MNLKWNSVGVECERATSMNEAYKKALVVETFDSKPGVHQINDESIESFSIPHSSLCSWVFFIGCRC